MVYELALATGHGVASIGTTYTNQHIVFAGQVGNNVAFALAPILTSDENVYASNFRRCKQVKAGCHSNQCVYVVRSIREDSDISIVLQLDNLAVVNEVVDFIVGRGIRGPPF